MLRSAALTATAVVTALTFAPYVALGRAPRATVASRAAHRSERRAIARAIRRSRFTRLARSKFNVTHVRISTVDRHWGKALLQPKAPFRHTLDPATAVVHRGAHRWSVRTVGTSAVGCVIPRPAVRRDLRAICAA